MRARQNTSISSFKELAEILYVVEIIEVLLTANPDLLPSRAPLCFRLHGKGI